MIEMFEGVPGSGKTYYAVSERFLKWIRAGRRVYIYVEGIYLDRLGLFEGVVEETLRQQITVWQTAEEVKTGLLTVDVGSAVLIDEVQTVFRSKEKVDPELLRWLETHRHKGIDLVLMCQQFGQVTLGVNRLVEVTTKFRRLDRFGLKNRYQAAVRGNPEELDVIRMFSGKYEPKMYAYYSSYSQAAIRESARGGSVLKSPTVVVGIVGLVGAVAWFSQGTWLSVPGSNQKSVHDASQSGPLPVPPSLAVSREVSLTSEAMRPLLVIEGGLTVEKDGKVEWLYVLEDGRLMTEPEVAVASGAIVTSTMVRGVKVLSGPGVRYGGKKREREAVQVVSSIAAEEPAGLFRKEKEKSDEISTARTSASPGKVDLLASPPDLVKTPSDPILPTPPDLR